ncbi:MAG: vitamin B12-dependent ribonucleotide reductase [Akkermansiaceae bacterium]|nr:vitamin B12-dependent ribonucleotide reductase [Akkermansiaceae bacterium]MCP5542887.1 vitamin B12-dependent ribonucleotide reductase [Akkermansiaceae bacterium]MCP5547050.1 vitamin B12-dependent ribonucleotide reductase [Akkermansiaceae bacterium]
MSIPPTVLDCPADSTEAPNTTRGLTFHAIFSTTGTNPFDEVEWEKRTAAITDDTGKAIFHQEDVEVPKAWSELATKIAVSKYFYGDATVGNDPANGGREHSVKQLIHRVTRTIADWGLEDGYFADEESAEAFHGDLTWLCLHQHGAFNSPVWFNVGLHHMYGIGGDGVGNWHWSDTKGEAVRPKGSYRFPQASACFIQGVNDDMEDIMRLAASEAQLFKFGSGTGSDLSTLRSSREKLTGGGKPSGPLSFLKIYDQVAGAIKSGGKTRRAAKMNTLKDWHPDIEEFIEAKTIEEKKAWALIEQGYDGSYNGDAYGSVMFQNENLSIRTSDEFMRAAIEDKEWWTKRVTDGGNCEKKSARALLRKIAEGTWTCGDPGMQFDTTIHTWHTCKGSGRQHSTNPCSEYLFLNDTACNLASLNLVRFRKADGGFDTERFQAAVRLFIVAQEILVDRASYPIKPIAENSHAFRTLGLGYANLGALIMSRGLGYDSDEGRALAGSITALMTGTAYQVSAEMAAAKGPFPSYRDARYGDLTNPPLPSNEEPMLEVIERHRARALDLEETGDCAAIVRAARKAWDAALEDGRSHGYRNAQVTVLAPTGTIGFLMDCDTTGIEPDIALVKYKLLAGGGMLKIVNRTVPPALRRLGYSDDEVAGILVHIEKHDTIEDVIDPETGKRVPSGLKPEHLAVFDCAFQPNLGSRSLHYRGHLRMMAAAQPFLSGAISKTVNMPESATVEDIMNTYIEAWQLGLKAVAIYRDGSKRSAPLATKKSSERSATTPATEELAERIASLIRENESLRKQGETRIRKPMPDTRMSLTHKFEIAGHEGYITAGLYENGQPGEVFVQMSKEGSTIGGLMDTVATLTSMSLQYGVPLEQLVNKFAYQRFEPSGFTRNPDIRTAFSITDYVFRWLGCEFIQGYKEATSPNHDQAELPMPEIEEMDKEAVNRPVPELSDPGVKRLPKADRVKEALGTAYMGVTCSNCGSDKVIRAGACGVCTQCGTSQGCS